jgi:hypothetical protein
MGRQIVWFFNSAVMFITDTDFSLWHKRGSWSLDASNENRLLTLINQCVYCCRLYFDL